ncbi:Adiponectin receptor protein 1 [Cyphellophora attinorum]|uniref:Adiponectin receptor protein 1 n=1 Tax=Cyphellophora attinorum TaxID=1664694 RepID=A0A0N1NWT9_9EURO|nr:Adiponectin receptor protein 1 [Phialophora attinorum]KPI37330.1 Adiponectin receptor protein 1 [Phialophora attinorum]
MPNLSFLVTYRRPRATFNRVLNERRRSVSAHRPDVEHFQLLTWDKLPEWCRDNHFVKSGYRNEFRSARACLKSIFSIHNETVNIWTHLVPAAGFLIGQILLQGLINHYYPDAAWLDRFVFACNVGAAVVTMTLSSLYHTLMCHSEPVSSLWLRIDYVGILTLILGSFFSGIYVGFYCDPIPRGVYWSMITILSVITSTLVLHPRLQGLRYRSLRTWAFILTALSGFAPILHGLYLHGWAQMWIRSGMPYYFLEGLIYGLGAFFFVTRIPESLWPGKFDIFFGSHQIFHVLVVIASLAHLYGVWNAFGWNYENQRTCPARN